MANKAIILGLIIAIFAVGCSDRRGRPAEYGYGGGYGLASLALGRRVQNLAGDTSEQSQRFIAVGHNLVIETPEAELQKAWQSAGEYCRTLRCEIIASNIVNRTHESPPSGTLSLRVVPGDVGKLFDRLGKTGTILQHTTRSEDKTATVIDVEAKIKNLTGLRDRLRAILATAPGSLKDVVEVERELSKAQSELDSLVTQRKVLANETEKVAVEVSFHAKMSAVGRRIFAPIAIAWQGAGLVLSESIAALITFIAAVIPWLFLVVPLFWILVKLLRKRKAQRAPVGGFGG